MFLNVLSQLLQPLSDLACLLLLTTARFSMGDLRCLWMLAGVIDYKLCDRQYECEYCPLDAGIRQGPSHQAQWPTESPISRGSQARDLLGYDVPQSLFYDSRHLWVRVEERGRLRVGLDDFAQRLTGRVYAVKVPATGTRVRSGEPCWTLVHSVGSTDICAPADGVVVETNGLLQQQPSLLNRDPYGRGSVLLMQPDDLVESLKQFLYGKQAERWYHSEVAALHRELMAEVQSPELGETIQDGGTPVKDLTSALNVERIQRIIERFIGGSGVRALDPTDPEDPGLI
jgi:glycine cleavage system H lipoate-binding protein